MGEDFRADFVVRLTNGRLAQLDRALVSGTRGRGFESRIAHQKCMGRVVGNRRSAHFVLGAMG